MDYHKNLFKDASLLFYKSGKLIAILPANRVNNNVYSHQGLSYGGLIVKPNFKLEQVITLFKTLLKWFYRNDVNTFLIKELPRFYTKTPNDELHYLAFILKAKINRVDTLSVLNLSEEFNLSKLRKRGVKKAQNLGLIIKEETHFKEFWNTILIPNLKERFNATPTHSLPEIESLHQKFPNNIKQFNVYNGSRLLAGVTVFETETVAHAQYISATALRQENGSLDFLFHELITTIYRDKLYFDFGISNENQGKNINQGLLYFKESFGARTITQSFYEFNTSNYKLLDAVML